MDARVSRLEEEMGEVRAILRRIEPLIVRIDAQIPYLATKAEVESVRHDLAGEIASVRHDLSGEIASVRQDLSSEIASVRQDLSGEIASVRQDLSGAIAGVRHELSGDIATLRTEAVAFRGEILTELAHKPTRGAMWSMGIALFGLVVAGIAVGAAYLPFLAARLHSLQ
jgi:chromosome segregation ATPase